MQMNPSQVQIQSAESATGYPCLQPVFPLSKTSAKVSPTVMKYTMHENSNSLKNYQATPMTEPVLSRHSPKQIEIIHFLATFRDFFSLSNRTIKEMMKQGLSGDLVLSVLRKLKHENQVITALLESLNASEWQIGV